MAENKPEFSPSKSSMNHIVNHLDYGDAPESPKLAHDWLDQQGRKFSHFIGGKWISSKNTRTTTNPADEKPLAQFSVAGSHEVDLAYRSARKSQRKWEELPGFERAKYLYALARQIQKKSRLLSVLETLDNGKPIRETRDIDIPLVVRHFYYHAGATQVLKNKFPNRTAHGVVGQIIPWNFPLLMLAWKVAPALASGNTVVLKPAEQTPLTALLFAQICEEIGLPPGVVNIITGDGNSGKAIIQHPGFDKIAFTGSTQVGKEIARTLSGQAKPLTLELGGKSPFIVFEQADLDNAVDGIVDAIWFNQGEVCCAGSRLLMQESIANILIEKIKRKMNTLRVGDPLQKNIDIGSLVSREQKDRVESLVQSASSCDLYQPNLSVPQKGFFYPPTLLTEVSSSDRVFQEEIFGPVLTATTFRTVDEAVELANNTTYGLSASVWSEDINQSLGIVPQLKSGVVWVNSTNLFDASTEFGGVKQTGYGREGGLQGMLAYLKTDLGSSSLKSTGKSIQKKSKNKTFQTEESTSGIDKTQKLFIGGKQCRPDSGYSLPVYNPQNIAIGCVGQGNRKDIRNAVEAAAKAMSWGKTTPYLRSQILYFLAENIDRRKKEMANRLVEVEGVTAEVADWTMETSLKKLFQFAAASDQHEGHLHRPPMRGLSFTIPEPVGIIAVVVPESSPFLSALTMMGASLALGNRVVMVTSTKNPLILTDLYQVLETSDIPPGVVNIITGLKAELMEDLAGHGAIDAIWAPEEKDFLKIIELEAANNLKRTFVSRSVNWESEVVDEVLLNHASEYKSVWIPYGE